MLSGSWEESARSIQLAVWGLCLLVGGPLNLVLLCRNLRKLCSKKERQSRVLWLKLQLNLSDSLILLGYVLSKLIWELTFFWEADDATCRAVKFLHSFSFTLCSASVATIGLDRMLITVRPFTHRDTARRRTRVLIGLAWAYAAFFAAPQAAIFTAQPIPDVLRPPTNASHRPDLWQCNTVFNFDFFANRTTPPFLVALAAYHNTAHLLTIFWLPLALISVCYGVMVVHLCRHYASMERMGGGTHRGGQEGAALVSASRLSAASSRLPTSECSLHLPRDVDFPARRSFHQPLRSPGLAPRRISSSMTMPDFIGRLKTGTESGCQASERAESRRAEERRPRSARARMVPTTLALMTVFLVCWLPYHVASLLPQIYAQGSSPTWAKLIHLVGKLLIVGNAVANPFIYGPFGFRPVCFPLWRRIRQAPHQQPRRYESSSRRHSAYSSIRHVKASPKHSPKTSRIL